MEAPRPNEVEIFEIARQISCEQAREQYLRQVCGNDEQLLTRTKELLQADLADSFLQQPAISVDATVERRVAEKAGDAIGPYRLLQQIGEGGFGVVYMAEQKHPIRRKVALKIIKPGMDTAEVIARFEAERQALAIMDHPNIARIVDAGTTESGRPFFVMDLVRGVPITEFCDKNELPTRDRLELFESVCRAVQHAHQKGVIHRDLKPSNVMVTLDDGKPVPKVIDFGVAKAMNRELTEKTLFTAYGQMIGTPQYMSPEQAEMSAVDVDTRSDIYSLGVLLYQLLTGTTPIEANRLRATGYAEIQRIIREEEPPRPSIRLSALGDQLTVIARHRRADPRLLQHTIRGELDWIVMKTLEKERGRRYSTAIELATDVERFLHGEPVEACPPTMWYRFRKVAIRHRKLVATVATLAVSLVLGLIVVTTLLMETRQAYDGERQERLRANAAQAHAENLAGQLRGERETIRSERNVARRNHYASAMLAASAASQQVTGERLVADALQEFQPRTPNDVDLRGWEWYFLATGRQPNLVTLDDTVALSLDWHPTADRLATSHLDGTVNVWQWEEEWVHLTLPVGSTPVTRVNWCPRGERLLCVSLDGQTSIWNTTTWNEELSIGSETHGVAWGPDGQRVAVADARNVVVFDVATGSKAFFFPAVAEWISWSPDGKWIAATNQPNQILIWNVIENRLETTTELEGDRAIPQRKLTLKEVSERDALFYWSDDLLAVATTDKIRRIDIGSWQPLDPVLRQPPIWQDEHPNSAWSTDGRYAYMHAGGLAVVDVHRAESDEIQVANVDGRIDWHAAKGLLAIASPDGRLTTVDIERLEIQHYQLPSGAGPVAWNAAGDKVAVASDRVQMLYADREQPEIARGLSFSISPDDQYIAIADGTNEVKVWDTIRSTYSGPFRNDHPIEDVVFSPDRRWLAGAASDDKSVVVWDVNTRKEVVTVESPRPLNPRRLTWNRNGQLAEKIRGFGTVVIWQIPDGTSKIIEASEASGPGDGYAIISPDGSRVFSLPAPWVDVFDASSGRKAFRLWGHNSWERYRSFIVAADWTSSGDKLVTAALDGTLRAWDEDGSHIATYRRHASEPDEVRWHPSEERLSSGDYAGNIKIWDVNSQREVLSILAGRGKVGDLHWFRDGMRLVARLSEEPNLIILDALPAYLAARSQLALPSLNRRMSSDVKLTDLLTRAEIRLRAKQWQMALNDLDLAAHGFPSEADLSVWQVVQRRRIELLKGIAYGELGELDELTDATTQSSRLSAYIPVALSRNHRPSTDLGLVASAYRKLVESSNAIYDAEIRDVNLGLAERYPDCSLFQTVNGLLLLRQDDYERAIEALNRSLNLQEAEDTARSFNDARMRLFKMHYWWNETGLSRDPNLVWQGFLRIVGLEGSTMPRTAGAVTDADMLLQWHEKPQKARTLLLLATAHAYNGNSQDARATYDLATRWLELEGEIDDTTLQLRVESLTAMLKNRAELQQMNRPITSQ